jgi:hypothetical protein
MSSQRKKIALGLFILAFPIFTFVAEAAAQLTRPMQPTRTQPGKTQSGMMQQPGMPGMMQPGKTAQTRPATPVSKETYSIVEVDRDYQIVTASSLKDLKKKLEEEYKSAQKAYLEAKKSKDNKGATLPKPEKKTVKPVPGKSGIKTQEKAQDELLKLQAERDKGGRKKSVR